jgi:hypothetical protein
MATAIVENDCLFGRIPNPPCQVQEGALDLKASWRSMGVGSDVGRRNVNGNFE